MLARQGFLGSIVQVDVYVKYHPKVLEGVRVRHSFTVIEKWWQPAVHAWRKRSLAGKLANVSSKGSKTQIRHS
eukprot:310735-Pelagomonas_calceolata.AAC.1